MLENLLMIAGIVYSSVTFERAALLWFLLFPLANSVTVSFKSDGSEEGRANE